MKLTRMTPQITLCQFSCLRG